MFSSAASAMLRDSVAISGYSKNIGARQAHLSYSRRCHPAELRFRRESLPAFANVHRAIRLQRA